MHPQGACEAKVSSRWAVVSSLHFLSCASSHGACSPNRCKALDLQKHCNCSTLHCRLLSTNPCRCPMWPPNRSVAELTGPSALCSTFPHLGEAVHVHPPGGDGFCQEGIISEWSCVDSSFVAWCYYRKCTRFVGTNCDVKKVVESRLTLHSQAVQS